MTASASLEALLWLSRKTSRISSTMSTCNEQTSSALDCTASAHAVQPLHMLYGLCSCRAHAVIWSRPAAKGSACQPGNQRHVQVHFRGVLHPQQGPGLFEAVSWVKNNLRHSRIMLAGATCSKLVLHAPQSDNTAVGRANFQHEMGPYIPHAASMHSRRRCRVQGQGLGAPIPADRLDAP